MNKIRTEQWLAFVAALASACLAAAAYAFTTFETQDHAKQNKQDIQMQLSELRQGQKDSNSKLDQILFLYRAK